MDWNTLGDSSNLSEEDQRRMSTVIQRLQERDSLRVYNLLVEKCFNDCVNSFYRKSLMKEEERCVLRCAQKYLKHSMRVNLRFAEINNVGNGDATTD